MDRAPAEEGESAFLHFRWKDVECSATAEKKEQPMGLSLIGLFRNHGEEVEVGGRDLKTDFLFRFADRAFERRLAGRDLELSADGAP